MIKGLRWLKKEWSRNHRHHGGLMALARCARGSLRMRFLPKVTDSDSSGLLDALAFSVVPGMSALWAVCMERSLQTSSARVLIGDCSGGFKPLHHPTRVQPLPLLNALHGVKLDNFVSKICRAEYVIISDDDVFWLDDVAWSWALEQYKRDEQVAVVSFIPRALVSSVLRDKIAQPMGSYCLVIRREIWMREKLSFQIMYPQKELGYDWVYDTGDFANVQLLERGYRVVIAPPEIRQGFMVLDGTSTWTLKIQENAGKIRDHLLEDLAVRPEKALRTVYALLGMSGLISKYFPENDRQLLVQPQYLQTAEQTCIEFLPSERREQIRQNVEIQIATLAKQIGNYS